MNRLLLTLLALMTGLVAQASPAAAAVRAGGETEIGASATRSGAEASVQAIALAPRKMAAGFHAKTDSAQLRPGPQLAVATVLIRIDRARE